MAASIFVQTSAARKCDCGRKCEPYTSGIAGEYVRGKWRRIGGFCPACANETRAGIRALTEIEKTGVTVRPRSGHGGAECQALITALRGALGVS